jgi:excisionase family DNA binding protein
VSPYSCGRFDGCTTITHQQSELGERNVDVERTPINEVINNSIFEPLMDSVQAAKLHSGIHPDTSPQKVNDNGILFHIEAAGDMAFERLLRVPEAAELVGVHPKTLQAMARTGTVPCLRIGKYWLFRASSLDAWVRDRLESDHQSRRVSMEVIS